MLVARVMLHSDIPRASSRTGIACVTMRRNVAMLRRFSQLLSYCVPSVGIDTRVDPVHTRRCADCVLDTYEPLQLFHSWPTTTRIKRGLNRPRDLARRKIHRRDVWNKLIIKNKLFIQSYKRIREVWNIEKQSRKEGCAHVYSITRWKYFPVRFTMKSAELCTEERNIHSVIDPGQVSATVDRDFLKTFFIGLHAIYHWLLQLSTWHMLNVKHMTLSKGTWESMQNTYFCISPNNMTFFGWFLQ